MSVYFLKILHAFVGKFELHQASDVMKYITTAYNPLHIAIFTSNPIAPFNVGFTAKYSKPNVTANVMNNVIKKKNTQWPNV
jgi:hypothetical protein